MLIFFDLLLKDKSELNSGITLIGKGNDMADIAIITGATGGIGLEFVKAIHLLDDIDEIWAVGRNNEKLNYLKEEYEYVNILLHSPIYNIRTLLSVGTI